MMEERSGWLARSLERARENIQARPEHLKPARYRSKKSGKTSVSKSKTRRRAA
jgi:hypothetical protein